MNSRSYKTVYCRDCYTESVKIDIEAVAGVCSRCTMKGTGIEEPKKPSGYPRGWQFRSEFVSVDGIVFHKGIEQPDLKDTLKPTKIKKKVNKPIFDIRKEQYENEMKIVEEYKKRNGK